MIILPIKAIYHEPLQYRVPRLTETKLKLKYRNKTEIPERNNNTIHCNTKFIYIVGDTNKIALAMNSYLLT